MSLCEHLLFIHFAELSVCARILMWKSYLCFPPLTLTPYLLPKLPQDLFLSQILNVSKWANVNMCVLSASRNNSQSHACMVVMRLKRGMLIVFWVILCSKSWIIKQRRKSSNFPALAKCATINSSEKSKRNWDKTAMKMKNGEGGESWWCGGCWREIRKTNLRLRREKFARLKGSEVSEECWELGNDVNACRRKVNSWKSKH